MLDVRIDPAIVAEFAAIGRFAADHGWVPATSGNFSRRVDAGTAVVTRSGVDKGALGADDLIVVALADPLPPGVSAETPLHVARYRADASIGAIAHVHTVSSTVLSRLEREAIELSGYEMFKALTGFTTHESTLRVPIFRNAQDTAELASRIESALGAEPVPAYLLAGHGLYAWGATMEVARRHVEALEFLFRCALEEWRIQ